MHYEIDFVKCSPTSNMTILVMSDIPVKQHAGIAAQMMDCGHLYAEQVGFVETAASPGMAAKLRMAGGEFCGNACLSLAACLADQSGLPVGGRLELSLESSGIAKPVQCLVEKRLADYRCASTMPIPKEIGHVSLTFEGHQLTLGIVRYEDSLHLIVDRDCDELERPAAERLARLSGVISGHNLIGVMLYRPSTSELTPLVYVPALNSIVWEQGCGSGSASVAAYLAWINRCPIDIDLQQPGGIIHAAVDWSDGIGDVRITVDVAIVARGKAYINNDSYFPEQGENDRD